MAHRKQKQPQCAVCEGHDSKYTCPHCHILYCSLGCFKKHQEFICITVGHRRQTDDPTFRDVDTGIKFESENKTFSDDYSMSESTSLRPLTSLNWPYVPDQSAFPDPLKRNDPKMLQLHQYEAIATSSAIRKILAEHKKLPDLLKSIDTLRGEEREEALQRALGVTAPEIDNQLRRPNLGEDILALRRLAESIEDAVRGGNESALGLNWGEEDAV